MKKILLTLCYLLSINIINAQKNNEYNIDFGIPITKMKNDFDFGNFYIEGSISKPVFQNMFWGLGIAYSNIDTKPTNNLFTYDRNTFNPFIFLCNSFLAKNSKIDFSPQIKAGYSFYTYSLNEFVRKKQNDNGFFLAPGLVVNYKINDKWLINTHFFYNIIFNSYKNSINYPIPSNYITTQGDYIYDFNFGIGFSYKIN